jgi:branched-chain amino acid transport system substrate-binding protein
MRRFMSAALLLSTLVVVGCGSSNSSSTTTGGSASSAATSTSASTGSCKASIAIEAPLTGPVAQVGLEQLHFAQLAVADDNAANHTEITLAQDDTQLTPSLAVQKAHAITATSAVGVVGPAGSQEVEAAGPIFAAAGIPVVSGSATLPALTTDGKNTTFFRVVPDDDIQGPQDANYIVNRLKPKAVLVIDDDEAYSQGLVSTMIPIFKKAGITVNHQTLNGTDTGATLANAIQSLVTSQLNANESVTVVPWQTASQAQQFGLDAQKAGKKTVLFGTDGTNSPTQFKIPGSYVSAFGPDIAGSKSALDQSIVKGVAKFGPYGPFGLPTYEAADVLMKSIASVCQSGGTPSRSNVLAALKKTNIAATANPLGIPVAFASNGNLAGDNGYLFKIETGGKYVEIPPK